jgi:hypothetical protein
MEDWKQGSALTSHVASRSEPELQGLGAWISLSRCICFQKTPIVLYRPGMLSASHVTQECRSDRYEMAVYSCQRIG